MVWLLLNECFSLFFIKRNSGSTCIDQCIFRANGYLSVNIKKNYEDILLNRYCPSSFLQECLLFFRREGRGLFFVVDFLETDIRLKLNFLCGAFLQDGVNLIVPMLYNTEIFVC